MLTLLLITLVAQAAADRRQDPVTLVAEEVFQATVTSVEDGDSLLVRPLQGGSQVRIHLAGVDAPELGQPWGAEAKSFLSELVAGKTVTVRMTTAIERLARVEIDGSPLGLALIRNGMAWHCQRFVQQNEFASAESDARGAKRGLWNQPQPAPPWVYRGVAACWQQEKAPAKPQQRPDFSGPWTAVSPADRAGQKLTIVQDAKTLTIQSEPGERLAYKLEGPTSAQFTRTVRSSG